MKTVKAQMIVLSIVSIAASLVIAVNSTMGMVRLADLQAVVQSRSADGMQAQKTASMGAELYQVIADSVINRKFEDAAKDWADVKGETAKSLELSAKLADTTDEVEAAGQAKKAFDDLTGVYENRLLPLLKEGDTVSEQVRAMDGEVDSMVAKMQSSLSLIATSMEKEASDASMMFEQTLHTTIVWNVILALIALAALGTLIAMITRGLFKQLGGEPLVAAKIAETIANGDLTCPIELKRGDTTSLLANIKKMQSSLASMLREIQSVSGVVSNSAGELTLSAHQILQRSQQQNDSASSMSAAIEEMTVSIGLVADSAHESNIMSKRADETAGTAHQQVDAVTSEIQSIASDIANTGQTMETLGKQSEHIGNIVNVIRDIAGQTNLLALNAAIEAARAGEQGRGFAVVADEVRKLAERTESSTTEITGMVKSIQESVANAQHEMARNQTQIEKGVNLAGLAGDAMSEVRDSASGMISIISDIADALKEQKVASNQIAVNVERIAQMAEENDTAAGQITKGTDSLETSAKSLVTMIKRFKTS